MQIVTLPLAVTTIPDTTGMQQRSHREERVKTCLEELNTTACSCSWLALKWIWTHNNLQHTSAQRTEEDLNSFLFFFFFSFNLFIVFVGKSRHYCAMAPSHSQVSAHTGTGWQQQQQLKSWFHPPVAWNSRIPHVPCRSKLCFQRQHN